MRILIASHGYPPTVSGVTLVVQKTARAMARFGHEVIVVTASEFGEPYENDDCGVWLHRVRSAPNPFWRSGPIPLIGMNELEHIVESFRPQLLHTHEATLLALQLTRLSQHKGIPCIATVHYVPQFTARYINRKGDSSRAVENFIWTYSLHLVNHMDHVVFPTRSHQARFQENGLTAPSSVISNGVDVYRYRPPMGDDEGLATRYGLPSGPRILFVGRHAVDKAIDILIRAMTRLDDRYGAHLILVGDGDDRVRLERLADELNLRHCIHFLGFVPEEDLPGLYRESNLFAIASTCEVQSIPVLQAISTGLPVVAADAVALPELVQDGRNGFLVPPDDPGAMAEAIASILKDKRMASKMGKASLDIAKPHSEAATFTAYARLYEKLGARARRLPRGVSAGPSPA